MTARIRSFSWIWLPVLLAASVATSSRAAELKPVAVISFAGYDALKADLNFIGELIEAPALGDSLEGLLALVTRAQGLAGLKKDSPIGAYVVLGDKPTDAPRVSLFVPVSDVNQLLDAASAVVTETADEGEGFKRLKLKQGPDLFIIEQDGWAFVGQSKSQLGDLPDDPLKLLGDLPKKYDFAVRFNPAATPKPLIEMGLDLIRQGIEESSLPNETEEEAAARKKTAEEMIAEFQEGFEQLDTFTLGLAVDDKTRSVYVDGTYVMKSGSEYAAALNKAAAAKTPSTMAGFADPEAVGHLHFMQLLPEKDQKNVTKLIGEGRKQLQKLADEVPEEHRSQIKASMDDLMDVAEATNKVGMLNGGALMIGEGPYSFVAGLRVGAGKKLEKAVTNIIDEVKKSPGAPPFEFEAESKDGLSFHTVVIPIEEEEAAAFFGDEATLALAFAEDVVYVAFGDEPVQDILNLKAASKQGGSRTLPSGELQVHLAPIVATIAETARGDDAKQLLETAAESLEKSEKDAVQLTSRYVQNGETVRFEIQEGIIKAFGSLAMKAGMRAGR